MEKLKAAKTGLRNSNIEKGMTSGSSSEAYNILKAPIIIEQHKSAVIEDSGGNILTESTAVLDRCTDYSIQTLAYSRVIRPPHRSLKAYLG